MKLFTSDGAREFELDTRLWFVLTLSTISVPNLTTFLQAVLRADFWAEEGEEKRRKKEKEKEKKKKKANRYREHTSNTLLTTENTLATKESTPSTTKTTQAENTQ